MMPLSAASWGLIPYNDNLFPQGKEFQSTQQDHTMYRYRSSEVMFSTSGDGVNWLAMDASIALLMHVRVSSRMIRLME